MKNKKLLVGLNCIKEEDISDIVNNIKSNIERIDVEGTNMAIEEPNLLLEVDHIVPVSKGGKTEADNLQTLCWRCNRSKSNKE